MTSSQILRAPQTPNRADSLEGLLLARLVREMKGARIYLRILYLTTSSSDKLIDMLWGMGAELGT